MFNRIQSSKIVNIRQILPGHLLSKWEDKFLVLHTLPSSQNPLSLFLQIVFLSLSLSSFWNSQNVFVGTLDEIITHTNFNCPNFKFPECFSTFLNMLLNHYSEFLFPLLYFSPSQFPFGSVFLISIFVLIMPYWFILLLLIPFSSLSMVSFSFFIYFFHI